MCVCFADEALVHEFVNASLVKRSFMFSVTLPEGYHRSWLQKERDVPDREALNRSVQSHSLCDRLSYRSGDALVSARNRARGEQAVAETGRKLVLTASLWPPKRMILKLSRQRSH